MANSTDELMLLERVFLRLGSAETDDQLENVLGKFLPPVLLKLASQQEGVRKKVMELLIHVNKRIKTRPQVQLPVEVLLNQYKDPDANTFVSNFTIIYIRSGFPRLPSDEQVRLVPLVLNSLENKPQKDLDTMLLLILPLLGKVKIPTDPTKVSSIFGLDEKPHISKYLLNLLLDVLLLPYGALSNPDDGPEVSLPVPAGMSESSFKRITTNNPMKPEDLEEIKSSIVKFLSQGVFKDEDILLHLIIAAADTRFSVANLADMELKKVVGAIDWSSPQTFMALFNLYLGTQNKNIKPELKKLPANTRIKLKLLTNLCRITSGGLVFPACIQIVFDSLYGTNTNTKLKSLALNFTVNIINYAEKETLNPMASVLLNGMQKLIVEGEEVHQGKAYVIIGLLAQRYPQIVYHNIEILENFLKNLAKASPDLKLQIREGFLNLILAYKYDNFPDENDKDSRLNILFTQIKYHMNSEEVIVRFLTVKMLDLIFPPNHVASKFLLLKLTGDFKEEVSAEATKSLYGNARKSEIDLRKSQMHLPKFDEITKYVYEETQLSLKDSKYVYGNHVLPFDPRVFVEILLYLRLCLIKNIDDIPLNRDVLQHPCDFTPELTKYLRNVYNSALNLEKNPLLQYAHLIKQLLKANPSIESFRCLVEIVGCLPDFNQFFMDDLQWICDQLNSTKEELREIAALLYSIVLNNTKTDFDQAVEVLINQTNSKNLESQHGAILALGNCWEMKFLLSSKTDELKKNALYKKTINTIINFLKHLAPLLKSAACNSIGTIARTMSLPLEDGKPQKNDSPEAKRPTNEGTTKIDVVNRLLEIMNEKKNSAKLREKAARSLGLLCVGERFPHSKEIMQGLLDTARETKDVEVHFTIGESLVMCCQSVWSPEARDCWRTASSDYQPQTPEISSDDVLENLLDELIKLAQNTHPNSKQASCIWLLAVLKGCAGKKPITDRIQPLQNTFMNGLSENNDILQDVASKGLCLIYDSYKSEELLSGLVKQLTTGTRQMTQVTDDMKLFEEGQLGKSPTGGSLTTYKELCALASDLNKPDLIYKFMHLANHNTIWNSKKGAAYGFSTIAKKCGEDLKSFMPLIIPKLHRYQFDPTPNIQISMQNIWKVLVSEPQKTLEEYFHEILRDLLDNLNSSEYRVRQSCCLALQDLLNGAVNRSIYDCIDVMDEIWNKLFRVMDDHHESTRITANKTAKSLSKICVRACDLNQGKKGVKMVESLLPPLLNGISSNVAEIRYLCLQTISEIVKSAGTQLKPFLPKLIPALLQAAGESESTKLSYLSTMLGAHSQAQEVVDSTRASFAKSHFTTETVTKSLQYIDSTILEELIPKVVDIMKVTVGLGTRIACAHFITLLTVQMGNDLQPFAGKLLAVLVNGLTDRNAAVRKHYATAIGHLVSVAKDSSIEKLFEKLKLWYFEREDDSIRSACAHTVQSIGIHNQEILKNYSNIVMPLVFFAMHSEKNPDSEKTLEIWTDIWNEHSPGTESGIKQNITEICEILTTALELPSWTMKAQAANAIATVANKLGTEMDVNLRNNLIQILLNGLSGRTWNGKNKLLKALAGICTNCKDSLKSDPNYDTTPIINAVLKESRKEELVYKNEALHCLGEILFALEIDRFDEVYEIVQDILAKPDEKNEETSNEEIVKKREELIKLTETAYETLGLTWPCNKITQEKYREMFIEHCVERLPQISKSIQISVVVALYNFVDKLILLNENDLNVDEQKSLDKILDNIVIALKYTLNILKNTKLRKESLNVVLCLGKKLKTNTALREKLCGMFRDILPDLANDHQPEIKSRVIDIKNILSLQ